MRTTLVSMPWQLLELPSLAVGILHARLRQARPGDEVRELHAGIGWAEHLLEQSGGALGPADYTELAETGLHHGLGDWVFAGVLHDDPGWGTAALQAYAARHGLDVRAATAMRGHAAGFVDRVVDTLLAGEPDVVGFTTTFMQNVPSLAVARRLKAARPDVVVVFGGANCDGPMGAALHRNHPYVDAAVRGEGELALPAYLDHLEAGTRPVDVRGLCWRDGGRPVVNPEATAVVPPASIPMPDFDAWQAALEASPVREFTEPKLVFEGARGCWWGDKHQCTFCGLNGSFIGFRSKTADQVFAELSALVARHRLLDVVMVDNIIDMAYFDRLLPRLASTGWDLRVHYEVKSNLRPDQLDLLAAAGVVHVQPGIESLSGRVLGIMDKGVSGWRNVRLLRDCDERDITVSWNLLYGFPGETAADYDAVLGQLPALVHLQPPGGVTRLALERFSPYFERPELGFPERRPAELYRHVYDLPDSELADLVYLFDTPPRGIGGEVEQRLHRAVADWTAGHPTSTLLVVEDTADALVVADRRVGWPQRDVRMTGWRAAAYRTLERGAGPAAVAAAVAAAGHEVSPGELAGWLAELPAAGLVFSDAGRLVALATRRRPLRAAAGQSPPVVDPAVPGTPVAALLGAS
jgi:ribosomal peptide maturation radical SAM protein 1